MRIHSNGKRSPGKAVRDQILRIARRFGVFITREPDALVYEQHLRRILSAFEINCVLDVGSYQAGFAKMLRRLGYMGLIGSFEPAQSNFDVLDAERASDGKWRAHQLALGATTGTKTMQVFSGTTFHSFLRPSEYGLSRFPDKLRVQRTETVRVERLDNILDDVVRDVEN